MATKTKQLAHLFDATQCISCGACIVACSQTNFPRWLAEAFREEIYLLQTSRFIVLKKIVRSIFWFSANT